jgi:hypothetical protein
MFLPADSVTSVLTLWADFYAHSRVASTAVTFLHVGALVLAGGLALSTDRETLRAAAAHGDDALRIRHLGDRRGVHAWVIGGLAVAIISGLLLFAASVATFAHSWVFWTKMVLIALLVLNGSVTLRTEHAIHDHAAAAEVAARWRLLRVTALASIVLWIAISLAGVVLLNL